MKVITECMIVQSISNWSETYMIRLLVLSFLSKKRNLFIIYVCIEDTFMSYYFIYFMKKYIYLLIHFKTCNSDDNKPYFRYGWSNICQRNLSLMESYNTLCFLYEWFNICEHSVSFNGNNVGEADIYSTSSAVSLSI